MNLLEIIILILALYMAVSGFRKGFVKKLASMVSLVLSIVLVSVALPYVTEFLKTNTPVYEMIVDQCDQLIAEEAAEAVVESTGQEAENTNDYRSMGTELLAQIGRIEQIELIENLPLPDYMKDLLLDYNNAEGYKTLAVSTFRDYVTHLIADIILNVAAFIVSVTLVQLVLWLVITVLNILASIPVIRFVNRVAGLGLGLVQAVVVIWFFFLILSIFSGTGPGMYIMSLVRESQYLYELYDANLFMKVVLHAMPL